MNNYRKPFKDLFQVNLEAGFLRIFLAAFLIFILWSLLAVISAIFNPLGKINFASFLGLNSQNLAFSLFLDILQAYFSIFTISFLVIFLSVFYLGYETIAGFSFLIKSFPSKKFSKDYLSFCAFSFPKPKKLLIPDDLTNNFIDFPVGPLKTAIKPGYALLIRSRANYSAKFNDEGNSDDFEVFLTHNEEVIDCFNLNPGSITLYAENKTSMKSFLIELTYSFDLPNRHEEMAKFSNMLTMFEGRKIREIIEDFLISETRISINQYFGGFNGSSFISTAHPSEKSLNANENKSKAIEQKKYIMFLNHANKIKNQVNKRNRKRPLYVSPLHNDITESENHDENLPLSLDDQLNELLKDNLRKAALYLFGTDMVRAKIISINEQGAK